jgi:hypothetical protein
VQSDFQQTSLPLSLQGMWYGKIKVTQMDTYPSLHYGEAYCQAFIREINRYFSVGQEGKLGLKFQRTGNAPLRVAASDVWFRHGLRVQLTTFSGPALVPGGINLPYTLRDEVLTLAKDRFEQTRVDAVRIVDHQGALLHSGFTEVSALYDLIASRKMRIKLLNIDYDQQGKPLWKVLMQGEATR